jgi:hypothetical protein
MWQWTSTRGPDLVGGVHPLAYFLRLQSTRANDGEQWLTFS